MMRAKTRSTRNDDSQAAETTVPEMTSAAVYCWPPEPLSWKPWSSAAAAHSPAGMRMRISAATGCTPPLGSVASVPTA